MHEFFRAVISGDCAQGVCRSCLAGETERIQPEAALTHVAHCHAVVPAFKAFLALTSVKGDVVRRRSRP
jgi:hypothetical protein